MQYDLDDYILCQAAYGLNSRSEVELEYNPIISAPMDTVISKENAHLFRDAGVNICYPRGIKVEPNEIDFISVGLNEFKEMLDGEKDYNNVKICIDVANGNMPILHSYIERAKSKWPKIIVMSGNVASPEAFRALVESGCDYVRVGIGGGSGCLTSVHTGVGQGIATLISQCKESKEFWQFNCKIVADGGFKNYRDIIIALALGADYVMLGGILNKCLESASEKTVCVDGELINLSNFSTFTQEKQNLNLYLKEGKITTTYRGMSTKAVQKDWGRTKLQSAEGIEKVNVVEYTISGWMNNFYDYLKSAMSYSGAKTLLEFQEFARVETITPSVFNRFNK